MRRESKGFTLIEVILAAMLAALVAAAVFGTLGAGRDASRKGEVSGEIDQIARQALDRIAADLRAAVKPSKTYDTGFIGIDSGSSMGLTVAPPPAAGAADNPDAEARDTLDFVAMSRLPAPDRLAARSPGAPVAAPVSTLGVPASLTAVPAAGAAETGIDFARILYEIDDDPATPEQGLVRREQRLLTGVATDPAQQFDTVELAPEAVGLSFRYLRDAEWSDTWDSRQSDSLPQAVEVGLTLRIERHNETAERTLKTIVRCELVPPPTEQAGN